MEGQVELEVPQAGVSTDSSIAPVEALDIDKLLRSRSRIKLRDGRKLCFASYGVPRYSPKLARKTLLYFHGWPSSRLEPAIMHSEALKQGIRIIAIDRPGAGHSTYNPRGSFRTIVADVEQLLDHLGLVKVVLMASSGACGWSSFAPAPVAAIVHPWYIASRGSGGSPFASACAALLPERVEGLLLVCPLAPCFGREQELHEGLGPHSKRFFAMLNSAPWAARVQMAAVRQIMYMPQHTAFLRIGGFAREDVDAMINHRRFADVMRAASREGLRQGIRGPFRDIMLYATRPWTVEIENIKCPTVIWNGGADVVTPNAMARHYHRRIPGSRLHIVPCEGHLSLPFKHTPAILASIVPPASRL
ncbi:hypothetical protein N2152v2_007231 [Parachlorella kessleri]